MNRRDSLLLGDILAYNMAAHGDSLTSGHFFNYNLEAFRFTTFDFFVVIVIPFHYNTTERNNRFFFLC